MSYARLAPTEDVVVEYPISAVDIRRRSKILPFPPPEMLAAFRIVPVVDTAQPSSTVTQKVIEITPALVEGEWQRQWQVVNLTTEEIDAKRAVMLATLDSLIDASEPRLAPAELAAHYEVDAVTTPLIDAVVATSGVPRATIINRLTTRRDNWRTDAGVWLATTIQARQTATSGDLADIQTAIDAVGAL